jgi:hypothetical protein
MSHAPLPEHIPHTLRDCFAAQGVMRGIETAVQNAALALSMALAMRRLLPAAAKPAH